MFALIMAGGLGTRFWPKSRRKHPKQLLRIYGEGSLIQNTVQRLSPPLPAHNIYIVSTEEQLVEIRKQLPSLLEENYIVEPEGKNTAPCIGLSALFMERLDPEGVMVVLPADHLITNLKAFHRILNVGAELAAEREALVTIGVRPTYPATGYGYIQFKPDVERISGVDLSGVKTFAEKPTLGTARRFVQSGDFLWNSGIFIWKIKTILREIEENIPQLYDGLQEIRKNIGTKNESSTISTVYRQIRSVSIDYGVMEYAKNVLVLRGDFGWNDLGSWDEVYKLHDKDDFDNVLLGAQHIMKDSKGCFVDAVDKHVAMVGVDNLVVVDTGDALLICRRDRTEDVKEVVEIANRRKLDRIL